MSLSIAYWAAGALLVPLVFYVLEVYRLGRLGFVWRRAESVSIAEVDAPYVHERAYERKAIFERSAEQERIYDVRKLLIASYGTKTLYTYKKSVDLSFDLEFRNSSINIESTPSPVNHRHKAEFFANGGDYERVMDIANDEKIISFMRMNNLSFEVCGGFLYVIRPKQYFPPFGRIKFIRDARSLTDMVVAKLT